MSEWIGDSDANTEAWEDDRPACTCPQFGNGVVRGVVDPPAPAGRLLDPACPRHGELEAER